MKKLLPNVLTSSTAPLKVSAHVTLMFHIGQGEAKALNHFSKKHGGMNTESMAKIIFGLALAHPKEVAAWMNEHVDYRTAEGFVGDDALIQSRIYGRKEYKRARAEVLL